MTTTTTIEWTEQTWNPTTGCTKISAGCENCYAEVMANRLESMGVRGYENGFKLSILPDRLKAPLARKKPTTYFVNSMSDLFHKDIPFTFIDQVMEVIRESPHHTYQILTKRAERMRDYFWNKTVPENIWLGVSVENRRDGVPRIDYLREVAARVRFLSAEPLLENLGRVDFSGIHWVIVGGESGARARPMKSEWVESIRRQCSAQSVAFFFKQWGGWGADGKRRSKKENGRVFAGRTWDEMPILQDK